MLYIPIGIKGMAQLYAVNRVKTMFKYVVYINRYQRYSSSVCSKDKENEQNMVPQVYEVDSEDTSDEKVECLPSIGPCYNVLRISAYLHINAGQS